MVSSKSQNSCNLVNSHLTYKLIILHGWYNKLSVVYLYAQCLLGDSSSKWFSTDMFLEERLSIYSSLLYYTSPLSLLTS